MQIVVVGGAALAVVYKLAARWFKRRKVGDLPPFVLHHFAAVEFTVGTTVSSYVKIEARSLVSTYFAGAGRTASHACYSTLCGL
jgi:hypothetical protein